MIFKSQAVSLTNPRVLDGINLFKGLSIKDVDFIRKNLETVNLYRGCNVACSHCFKNAKSHNIATILYEDLIEFTDGFKTLSERLGDNVLSETKCLNIVDDSNPSDFPIRGFDGFHSVVDAMKMIYDKLSIPIMYVTAGWNAKSRYAQKAADDMVKMAINNPATIMDVEISLNPFSHIMNVSREALKNNNKDKADFFRNAYTTRMANTLATFSELFNLGKCSILYRHCKTDENDVGFNGMKQLYIEIYNKLYDIIGSKLKDIPSLDIETVTHFDKSHWIDPSGRARQYFSFTDNMQEQSELILETLKWNSLSKEEKMKQLENYASKYIDINGQVYATFPAIAVKSENCPIGMTVQTPLRLNYQNTQPTEPVFSDIDITI